MTTSPFRSTVGTAAFLGALLAAGPARASIEDPSVLPTPPMGFNDWARFECNLNQSLFVETADAMVSKGLLAAGFDRINLDDCWPSHERAPNGSLQWNETLFPKGLIWLGEYVKSKGFHFGIYEDAGNATCGGYPGTRGHEKQDAETFKSWGIDYLKLDGCNVYPGNEKTYQDIYGKWHEIFSNMTHPLVFSESAPAYFAGTKNNTHWYEIMDWVPVYGELARHSTDIAVYGLYTENIKYWDSIMTNYDFEVLLARYQMPGYYNDPDFIIADWPWLTLDEKKSQFGLWSSFSAPLIISSYIPDLTDAEVEYLTNRDVIAIDQDPLTLQATLVSRDGYFDVLTKDLADGDRLLTVLNRGEHSNSTTIDVERIGIPKGHSYSAKDLWTGKSSEFSDAMHVTLDRHSTVLYRISGVSSTTPTGMIFNTASMKCLTASGPSIAYETCDALDSQVWTVSSKGMISPLSAPEKCLEASTTGVALKSCKAKTSSMTWVYHVTGNVINSATGLCLQEHHDQIGECGFERDGQVFGLPSGVHVVRGNVV